MTDQPYNIRFDTLAQATRFFDAVRLELNPSPENYGAIPPFITDVVDGLIRVINNPEYENARYEMIYISGLTEEDVKKINDESENTED
jgi:hypothetical protein